MTRAYRQLPPLDIAQGRFSVRCVQDEDIEPIRQWRNAQMEVLRQATPISPTDQIRYFAAHVWPQMESAQPDLILVAILRDGRRIGYGGLVHCAWEHGRAEISVLFDPAIAAEQSDYREALLGFLGLIEELAFARLGLNRLTLETFAIRTAHIGVLEEAGYVLEGRLREHVTIDGERVDSLLHARLASDRAPGSQARGGRTTSSATRSILVPASGGS